MSEMKEAIDKEDWDRMQKGLPPRKKAKVKIPEPEAPAVKDQIRLAGIPVKDVTGIDAKRRTVQNEQGCRFIGFDVSITVKGAKGKNGLKGWMGEGDFYALRRELGDAIDTSRIEF